MDSRPDWFRTVADIPKKTGLSLAAISELLSVSRRQIENARFGRCEPRYSLGKALLDWRDKLN